MLSSQEGLCTIESVSQSVSQLYVMIICTSGYIEGGEFLYQLRDC